MSQRCLRTLFSSLEQGLQRALAFANGHPVGVRLHQVKVTGGNIRSNAQQPTIKISGDVPAAIYALKAEDGLLLQVFATPQKIDNLGSDRPSERFVG